MKRTVCLLLLSIATCVSGATSERSLLRLTLIRDSNQQFHVEASAEVHVPLKIAWETVRDYDHLTEFIPSIVESKRVTRDGRPLIQQTGRAKFLLFSFEAKALLVEEADPSMKGLRLSAVEGDFSKFDSQWKFAAEAPNVTFLSLRSEAVLKRWVPQWLARRQMKIAVRDSLEALLAEMERRGHGAPDQ